MKRSAPAALPLLIGLGAVCAVLMWQVAPYLGEPQLVTSGRAADRSDPTVRAEPGAAGVVIEGPIAPDPGLFAVVAARNLFAPDRAPVMPASPAAAAAAAPPGLGLELSGVLLVGDGGIAVLRNPGAREATLRLQVGQSHGGWRLEGLTARSATFRQGGDEVTLTLDFAGSDAR